MAEATLSLTLNPAVGPAPALAKIAQKAKEQFEKTAASLSFRTSPDRLAHIHINATKKHFEKNLGWSGRNDLSEKEKELVVFIARTNAEAAEKAAEELLFPYDQFKTKEEYISHRLEKKFPKGEYDPNTKILIINLQEIERHHEGEWEIEACIALTAIHETLHHFFPLQERLEKRDGTCYDVVWLGEALTEFAARRTLTAIDTELQTNHSQNITCDDTNYLHFAERFASLLGPDGETKLENVLLSGDIRNLDSRLRAAGIDRADVDMIYELGQIMSNRIVDPQSGNKKGVSQDEAQEAAKALDVHIGKIERKRRGRDEFERRRGSMDDFLGRDGNGDKPGGHPTSIYGIEKLIGEDRRDAAARLSMAANLYLRVRMNKSESTVADVVSTVASAYRGADCILANTFQVLFSAATENFPEIPLTSEATSLPPTTTPPTMVLDRCSMTKDALLTSSDSSLAMAVPADQSIASVPEPPLSSVDAPVLRFGENIAPDTVRLVEAAATQVLLANAGEFPSQQQIQTAIQTAFETVVNTEAIVPDAAMITTQILADTLRSVQDRQLKPEDAWLREPAVQYAQETGLNYGLSFMSQPYDASRRFQVAEAIDTVNELSGLGSTLADKSYTYFLDVGVDPTCADVFGLAMTAAQIAIDGGATAKYDIMSEIPGVDVCHVATMEVLQDLRNVASASAVNDAVTASASQPAEDVFRQYWNQQIDQVSQFAGLDSAGAIVGSAVNFVDGVLVLARSDVCARIVEGAASAATDSLNRLIDGVTSLDRQINSRAEDLVAGSMILCSLLSGQMPSDLIVPSVSSLAQIVSSDDRFKSPDGLAYNASMGVVGATSDVQDIRKAHKKKFEFNAKLLQVEPLAADRTQNCEKVAIFALPPSLIRICDAVRKEYPDPYDRLMALFEIVKTNGHLGIQGSMSIDDRPKGSIPVTEVFETKKANCLELTMAYLAMAKRTFIDMPDFKFFGLDIVNIHQRVEVGHASVGVLIDDDRVSGHPHFESDWTLRQRILISVGSSDTTNLRLLVIDPVNSLFDYRFHKLRYLDDTKLFSCFHSNSAAYASNRGDDKLSKTELALAAELWPTNPRVVCSRAIELLHQSPGEVIPLLNQIPRGDWGSVEYAQYGFALRELSNPALALEYLNRAIALDAFNAPAFFSKAHCHLVLSPPDYASAGKCLRQLISALKKERKHLHGIHVNAMLHGYALDTKLMNSGVERTHDMLNSAFHLLAIVELYSGNIPQAKNVCAEAISIEPDSHRMKHMLSIVLLAESEWWFAKHDLLRAQESRRAANAIRAELDNSPNFSGPDPLFQKFYDADDDRMVFRLPFDDLTEFCVSPTQLAEAESPDISSFSKALLIYVRLVFGQPIDFSLSGWDAVVLREDDEVRAREFSVLGAGLSNYAHVMASLELNLPINSSSSGSKKHFKQIFAQHKKDKENIEAIKASNLTNAEKAYLRYLFIDGRLVDAKFFVAFAHQEIMRTLDVSPSSEYVTALNKFNSEGKTGRVCPDAIVNLAEIGLGSDCFFGEVAKLWKKRLFKENPLSINRAWIKAAAEMGKKLDRTTDDDLKLAVRSHLKAIGRESTEEAVADLLPKFKKIHQSRLCPLQAYRGFDINHFTFDDS